MTIYFFVTIKNGGKFAVAEDNLAAHEAMRFCASDLFPAIQQSIVDQGGAEFLSELLVINSFDFAILTNLSRHRPGVDVLAGCLRFLDNRWRCFVGYGIGKISHGGEKRYENGDQSVIESEYVF